MKTTEVTRTVKCDEYYCDVCNNRVDSFYLKVCDVCGKHLCVQCTVRSEDVFDGKSPSYYCRECWNIGDIYRADIAEEIAKRYASIANIENRWKKAGKAGWNK